MTLYVIIIKLHKLIHFRNDFIRSYYIVNALKLNFTCLYR